MRRRLSAFAHPLKLHLRVVDVAGTTLRLLSPRPSLGVRFSTNLYHDTWHILSSASGASVLARLLWGLAYQQRPGTAVLIGPEHLVTTPFDGDPPDPIVLAPTTLTPLSHRVLSALRPRLASLGPSQGTVKLHTFGLDPAERHGSLRPRDPAWRHERVGRLGGFLVYSAPPEVLRAQAEQLLSMYAYKGMAYEYLGRHGHWTHAEGEVQTFSEFDRMVGVAARTRAEMVGERAGVLPDSATKDLIGWTTAMRVSGQLAAR